MIVRSSVAVVLLTGSILVTSAALAETQAAPPRARARIAASSAAEVSTARGVIKSVTASRLELEVKPAENAPDTVFALDDKTVVQRLGKALTARDLKVGDPVTVSYAREGGKAVATRVWLRASGGASGSPAMPRGTPPAKGR